MLGRGRQVTQKSNTHTTQLTNLTRTQHSCTDEWHTWNRNEHKQLNIRLNMSHNQNRSASEQVTCYPFLLCSRFGGPYLEGLSTVPNGTRLASVGKETRRSVLVWFRRFWATKYTRSCISVKQRVWGCEVRSYNNESMSEHARGFNISTKET